jgi:hypothetical protein
VYGKEEGSLTIQLPSHRNPSCPAQNSDQVNLESSSRQVRPIQPIVPARPLQDKYPRGKQYRRLLVSERPSFESSCWSTLSPTLKSEISGKYSPTSLAGVRGDPDPAVFGGLKSPSEISTSDPESI